MTKADQINNSYQIEEEFKEKKYLYKSRRKRKQQVDAAAEKPGPVKIYTEEEILLYKLEHFKSPLNKLTVYC